MNYWPRWISAIKKRTASLSLAQMGAYDRLLDHYYAEEQPLPGTLDECCRICSAIDKAEREAVRYVLERFFVLDAGRYTQERADAEIKLAKPKIEAARFNGRTGGRPRKNPTGTQRKPTGFPAGSPPGTHEEPRAKAPHPQQIHSDADASGAAAPPPADLPLPMAPMPPGEPHAALPDCADVIFALGVPLLTAAGVSDRNARSMLGLQRKQHGDGAVVAALQRCATEKPLQPVPWLQAVLGGKAASGKGPGRHAGFTGKDYRQEIEGGIPTA